MIAETVEVDGEVQPITRSPFFYKEFVYKETTCSGENHTENISYTSVDDHIVLKGLSTQNKISELFGLNDSRS